MKYTRKSVIERYNAGETPQIIPFWGHTPNPKKITKACFSQWYDCRFDLYGEEYHTAEQYMMAQKAQLFRDRRTLYAIMDADNPREYKALGRKVERFDAAVWDREKYGIVLMGNLAKFSQNPELLAYPDSTGDAILVEASPFDDIWGVKLGMDDARIMNPNERQGENLLGFALMETRDILREWNNYDWDIVLGEQVEWNCFENQYHHDGDNLDSTFYASTGWIRRDGKCGVVKNDGSEIGRADLIVFLPQWDSCEEMGTGYTFDDKVVVETCSDDFARLKNTWYFVRVRSEGKCGVVDTAGRIVTPCKWDEIDCFGNARQGVQWGFVNLLTSEETPPRWPENPHLNPYTSIWSADTITNWSSMFGPGSGDRHLEWENTMSVFRAGRMEA